MRAVNAWLARNRRRRGVPRLMASVRDLHRGYENFSYDFHENGEERVLQVLERTVPVRTVFDVGGNTGDWSTMAVRAFPAAHVHAFEIVPQTAERFRANTAGLDRLTLNDVGLSDQEGVDEVHIIDEWSPLATAVPDFVESFHRLETRRVAVTTTTGDRYCERQSIERIDFLKVDVEGYEHKVLGGFSGMLERDAIRAIQFEYGYVNIATRFLLKDFYDLLTPMGMVVGKIYPGYVDFRDYRYEHEDFLGPNFLAVRAEEAALIAALSGRV